MAQQRVVEFIDFGIKELYENDGKLKIGYVIRLLRKAEEIERQNLIGLLKWMNEVAKKNPMALETDHDDIVDMYLNGYYKNEHHDKKD